MTKKIESIELSICIVVYGDRYNDLKNALNSIFKYLFDQKFEVIVIENGSSSRIHKLLIEFPNVIIIRNRQNIGYSPAMNQALRESKGKYILCHSMDAEIMPGSIQKLVAFMEKHPNCGIAGPLTWSKNGDVLTSMHHPNLFVNIWGEIIPLKSWLRGNRKFRNIITFFFPNSSGLTSNYRKTQRVRLLSGGLLLISRRFLNEVGFLDENIPLGPDDYDWCHRAIKKGFEIWYVSESQMIHKQKPKEKALQLHPIYLFLRLPSLLYLFQKYHRGIQFWFFRLSILILLMKWKIQICYYYGSKSIQYKAITESYKICLSFGKYFEEVVKKLPQKIKMFSY